MTQVSTVSELLPCPFCGATLEKHGTTFAHPRGSDCILVTTGVHANDAERIAAWNRRATREASGEPVAWQKRSSIALFEPGEHWTDWLFCDRLEAEHIRERERDYDNVWAQSRSLYTRADLAPALRGGEQ